MDVRFRLLLAALALCAAPAGAAPPRAGAEFRNHQLTLRFDQPMLTWQGQGALQSIRIEPELDCAWQWNDADSLSCERAAEAAPVPAGTPYTIHLGPGLWSQAGEELAPATLSAPSRLPELRSERILWQDRQPRFLLVADSQVTTADLREALVLQTGDGRDLPLELEALTPDQARRSCYVRTETCWRVRSGDTAYAGELALRVRPGLRTTEGPLRGTQDKQLARAYQNEPFRLRRWFCGHGTPLCPAGGTLALEFSREPDPALLQRWLAQLPAGLGVKKMQAEAGSPDHSNTAAQVEAAFHLRLDIERPNHDIRLHVPDWLRASDGEALQPAADVTLRSDNFRPELSIPLTRRLLQPGDALPVIGTMRNMHERRVVEKYFDASGFHSKTGLLRARSDNREYPLRTLGVPSQLRREGGLVIGELSQDSGQWPASYAIAYAPFHLSALWSPGQLLLWASEWQGAAARAGVEMELLQIDESGVLQVLARGTTGADGTVLMVVPEKPVKRRLLVRARSGNQTSVLPLEGSAGDGDWSIAAERAALFWGVSDRPLYRPGDRVSYRAWLRQRTANHLQRVPQAEIRLQLGGYGQNALQEWTAPLDATGSVAAEIVLPKVLPDGRYCVEPIDAEPRIRGGVCFDVLNYHAAAISAELKTAQSVLYDGDTLQVTAESGFFSGGPAADATVELQTLLMPQRLQDIYAAFSDFEFIYPPADRADDGGEGIGSEELLKATLDADGRHIYALPIRIKDRVSGIPDTDREPIPFGKLDLSAGVSASSSTYAQSGAISLYVSRFRHFVGLRAEPGANTAEGAPLSAVVIDAQGNRVTDAQPVTVSIERVADANEASKAAAAAPSTSCTLQPGQPQRCATPATAAGLYRFTARSGDAAPVTLDRYVSGEAAPVAADEKTAQLLRGDSGEGPAQITLRQPFAQARVLFAVQHGVVLKHWTATVQGPELRFALHLPADWAPGVSLSAVVYDATAPAHPLTAELKLDVTAAAKASPLQLQVPSQAKPGEEISLRLRNTSAAPVDVVLAVADESIRLQAPDILALRDPQDEKWLGALREWGQGKHLDLANWAGAARALTLHAVDFSQDTLESIVVTGSRIRREDLMVAGVALGPGQRPAPRGQRPGATVRSNFADTAYWRASLPLAPGAEETLRVRLPDNLTRWQVSAWTVQGEDGFHLDQAYIHSSLPLELRAEVPARLYNGDTSRVAVAVRNNTATAQTVDTRLGVEGAGIAQNLAQTQALQPAREFRLGASVAPTVSGEIGLQAQAHTGTAGDGLAVNLPVLHTLARERVAVSGWLDQALKPRLPELPRGAQQATLSLRIGRGLDVSAAGWITGLRDYAHRCWEQSLSRAIGAAAALRLQRAERLWPQAQQVIDEVLPTAPIFQDVGLFTFFLSDDGWASDGNVSLTAYSVHGLQTLADWGHASRTPALTRARDALARYLKNVAARTPVEARRTDWREVAAALGALPGNVHFDALIRDAELHWLTLDTFARSRLLLAMHARAEVFPQWQQRREELRNGVVLKDGRRVLRDPSDRIAWLGSDLRDQCALIDALQRIDANDPTLPQWRRGVVDLYTGGGATDTQAAAQCLMVAAAAPGSNTAATVTLQLAGRRESLHLPAQQAEASWSGALPPQLRELQLQTEPAQTELSYAAEISYALDQRESKADAIGLSVQRNYSTLRSGRWQPAAEGRVRAGEWVRVGLRVQIAAPRHHVAVVDHVPGGLRPEQFELDRVGGVELRGSSTGSAMFNTRQHSDTDVRFYARQLPPGEHWLYYYARAAHTGDYFAPPATAELMYGGVSTARTAPQRLRIGN